MDLTDYRTLGRSGLVVSPLALGTGRWGGDRAVLRAMYDAYVGAGGNFVDTADVYGVEETLGDFVKGGGRDGIVLASKCGFAWPGGGARAGGNGAGHIRAALDGSLARLRTDHLDLYWIHVWDQVTPAEEVLGTLVDLARVGKIRHYGLSNVPAWYAAKMATLASAHGLPAPIALQFQFSLAERGIELEHFGAAGEFGLAMVSWSPLGGGLLARRGNAEEGTRNPGKDDPFGALTPTEHRMRIREVVRRVAEELDATAAQVALAWVVGRSGISSTLIGASRAAQVAENIAALDVALTPAQQAQLDAVSAVGRSYPYTMFTPEARRMILGGRQVAGSRE